MQKDQKTLPKEDDPAVSAIKNNPCSLCRSRMLPICKGHGGGGGGGGGSGGGGKAEGGDLKMVNSEAIKKFYITNAEDGTIKVVFDLQTNDLNPNELEELEEKILLENFEELFQQQLEIDSDPEELTLTIQIKPSPDNQNEVLFLQDLLKLLKDQSDSLIEPQKFLVEDYSADLDIVKGELRIHIPDKELYHKVIKELSSKALLFYEEAKHNREEKQQQVPLEEEQMSARKNFK